MLDGSYEPIEIKTAKSIKPFHVLQVCFYAMLLEQAQGRRPETATVVLADKTEETVDLDGEWPEFERQLARAIAVVDRSVPTDLAIFSGCGECVWQGVCAADARDRNDVTSVAGLRRATKPALAQAGIVTVHDLANSEPERLLEIRGIGEKSAERLPVQARCQANGQVVHVGKPTIPVSDFELYYDIEGEPNLDIDYLHGLLVVEFDKEPEYVAFLADRPEDEGGSLRTIRKQGSRDLRATSICTDLPLPFLRTDQGHQVIRQAPRPTDLEGRLNGSTI